MRIVKLGTFSAKAEYAKAQKGLEQGLDDTAFQAKLRFLMPTEDWHDKPGFDTERSPGVRVVFTNHQNYFWINFGTNRQGRRTVARPGGRLHLPSKWEPKTHPMDLESKGGSRIYTPGENLFRSVPMSSIEARRWDEIIYKEFEDGLFQQLVQAAINRG